MLVLLFLVSFSFLNIRVPFGHFCGHEIISCIKGYKQMLKLTPKPTKQVIYQSLEVDVPVDTKYMWLVSTDTKTVLLASPNKPTWCTERQRYVPPRNTNEVATFEPTELNVQQVKNSLETEEPYVSKETLEKLEVIENLVNNLRSFADSIERNVSKAKSNLTTEHVESLVNHMYGSNGEVVVFFNNLLKEAEKSDMLKLEEDDADDHEAYIKFITEMLK